jgi:hypothetical protein
MAREEEALLALKDECVAACQPHHEAVLAAETEDERQQALADGAEAHQPHAQALADAYQAFQNRSGTEAPSNPAPEGETPLTAHLVVESEAGN